MFSFFFTDLTTTGTPLTICDCVPWGGAFAESIFFCYRFGNSVKTEDSRHLFWPFAGSCWSKLPCGCLHCKCEMYLRAHVYGEIYTSFTYRHRRDGITRMEGYEVCVVLRFFGFMELATASLQQPIYNRGEDIVGMTLALFNFWRLMCTARLTPQTPG